MEQQQADLSYQLLHLLQLAKSLTHGLRGSLLEPWKQRLGQLQQQQLHQFHLATTDPVPSQWLAGVPAGALALGTGVGPPVPPTPVPPVTVPVPTEPVPDQWLAGVPAGALALGTGGYTGKDKSQREVKTAEIYVDDSRLVAETLAPGTRFDPQKKTFT